jgi:hypothetical protein
MTIKEILDSLPEIDRRVLMFAFESGITQHVKLDNNKFVGVNCEQNPNLQIEESAGSWSKGTIKGTYQ